MKIGVNSRIYQNIETGIPYYIKCLYQALFKKNSDDEYVFFQTNNKKTLGVTNVCSVPDNIFGIILFDGFLINHLATSAKVNIVHGPSNVLPLFKRSGLKYVVTIHDLSFLVFPKQYSRMFNIYYRFVVRRSINNADLIIADSQNTKEDIKRFYHVAGSKIKVIYLGVNDIYFSPKRATRIITDQYFFSLTTHPRRKNIYRVLEVFADNKNLSGYKYVVAGLINDEQLLLLKKKIKELKLENRVILFGYATEEELKNLYQNAEFFIYPSLYEGFGLPVLEAMICNCPVITSNNSSLIEITPHKEWLVNPYDNQDISDKINKMLSLSEKERKELLVNNYNFARNFTWEKSAREYKEIFDQL